MLVTAPKVALGHVNTVINAPPAVGAVEPGTQVAVGKGENGYREGVPALLHAEYDEQLPTGTAGLHHHRMKQV